MTREEYRDSVRKRAKYGNNRSSGFDSMAEAHRFGVLCLLQKAGRISGLRCQVPYILQDKTPAQRSIKFVVDFEYFEGEKTVVEDVKGFATAVYKLKKKMFHVRYPDVEFREIKSNGI